LNLHRSVLLFSVYSYLYLCKKKVSYEKDTEVFTRRNNPHFLLQRNCKGGIFLGGIFLGAFFRVAFFSDGYFPGGFFLGGFFPRSMQNAVSYRLFI